MSGFWPRLNLRSWRMADVGSVVAAEVSNGWLADCRSPSHWAALAHRSSMSDARVRLAEMVRERLGRKASGRRRYRSRRAVRQGDDASDFMDDFSSRFRIDGENYRWYFHDGEEGANSADFSARRLIGVCGAYRSPRIFWSRPSKQSNGPQIPSPSDADRALDIRVNQFLVVVPFVLLALWLCSANQDPSGVRVVVVRRFAKVMAWGRTLILWIMQSPARKARRSVVKQASLWRTP